MRSLGNRLVAPAGILRCLLTCSEEGAVYGTLIFDQIGLIPAATSF
ncbi:MAG: hypothetical protein ACI8Z5_001462 [Lentimonas sp.]|jgi:hypothetical protein